MSGKLLQLIEKSGKLNAAYKGISKEDLNGIGGPKFSKINSIGIRLKEFEEKK